MNEKIMTESTKDIRKQRKRQIKREIIINYAEESFTSKSYMESTLDEIALNSGNTKATIYNYFTSKEDLLAAVMSRTYKKFIDIFRREITTSDNKTGLRSLSNSYILFDKLFPGHSELLNSAEVLILSKNVYDKFDRNEELSESEIEYKQSEDEIGKLFIEIIYQYIKPNSQNQDFPLKMGRVIYYFTFTIREAIRRRYLLKDDIENDEILEIILTILEKGIQSYLQN